ncbi:unnamed protein product [Didymodactylos carnosus]|uniref:Uncharacterized protein n=1 Tax=Didymodactylos carnosus TaxID=1234261 RepID=A0A8S2X4L9_9BILA|nr:unnamed protein product [Didymodactylos carnosus]
MTEIFSYCRRRYGRQAVDIVGKTDQLGGMYSSGNGILRSNSVNSQIGGLQRSGSFGSIPLGDIRNLPPEGFGPGRRPIRVNY